MAKSISKSSIKAGPDSSAKRTYLKQSDVPSAGLDEALRIPQAILEHYAGKPTSPLYVAKALNVDPKGSQFKVLSGAAIALTSARLEGLRAFWRLQGSNPGGGQDGVVALVSG